MEKSLMLVLVAICLSASTVGLGQQADDYPREKEILEEHSGKGEPTGESHPEIGSFDRQEQIDVPEQSKYKEAAEDIAWGEVEAMIQDENELLRRRAAWKLAVDDPEQQNADVVVPLIASALDSHDLQVRAYGAAAAYRVAFFHQPREHRRRGQFTPYDMSRNPDILPRVVEVLNHPDVEARNAVIVTLALTYDPIQELQPTLIEQYNKTDSIKEKGSLLELMQSWDYRDEEVIQLMIQALESENAHVQERAANALGQLHPADAILPLIRSYLRVPDEVKEDILRALAQYHAAGQTGTEQFRQAADEVRRLHEYMEDLREDE